MDKILITVDVPSLMKTFDIFIPRHALMHEVLKLIKHAVSDISDGNYIESDSSFLCRKDDGEIINVNASVADLKIYNGSRLILF